jgi:hypothetical protein
MRIGSHIVSALAGGLLALWGLTSGYLPHGPREGVVTSADAATAVPATPATVARKAELRITLRSLFDDRATYTRNALISTLASAPDLDAVTARLMRNQDEIGGALKAYLGDAAGKTLTGLLKEQVTLSLAVVKAAKAGDKTRLAAAKQKAADNAGAIGALLSAANPTWQKTAMADMLQKHLDTNMREVTARLVNDWLADIRASDERHQQMLAFADTLADGISKQYPDKFAG